MKKIFEEPKLIINDLAVEDVITASIATVEHDEDETIVYGIG